MNIQIFGINDRCANVPLWIYETQKSYLLLTELPVTQEIATSVFSLMNSRKSSYFSSESQFSEYVNNYFNSNLGFKVNPMMLHMIYRMKKNYVFCYPIGCIDNFDYKNEKIKNITRFNRSVAITNNALAVLNDYQKTIDEKLSKMNNLFENSSQSQELKSIYLQGNKQKFLEETINYFLYSRPEMKDAKPSVSKAVLEEIVNVTFDYLGDEKIYINPFTYNKMYYKIKHSFDPETVNLFIGEPHRIFLEHFLSQRFPEISSSSKTLEFMKTSEKNSYINEEIKLAEKENLIIF